MARSGGGPVAGDGPDFDLVSHAVTAAGCLVIGACASAVLQRHRLRALRGTLAEEAREQSVRQVRRFVSDASHELRTPLAAIRGYAELARTSPGDSSVALERVDAASLRMTSLVDDLLLLARLEAGNGVTLSRVDLPGLVGCTVDQARRHHPDHRFEVVAEEGAGMISGDPERLAQALAQMLRNAGANTPAGTTVTVVVRPDGFDVHDDGPGLPAEVVDHAFDRFARSEAARARPEGAGLGLALVHAIARAHGGRVRVDSAPGDTRFAVRLPAPARRGEGAVRTP